MRHYHKKDSVPQFMFHPHEIAFCGFSNSGKTTLILKLIQGLPEFKIGYVKHDVHQFAMDTPGKDTFVVKESGAERVFINSKDSFACLGKSQDHPIDYSHQLLDLDFVFVEGYKNSMMPKIIIIDDKKEILVGIKDESFSNIMAYIGKEQQCEELPEDVPYFQIDDVDQIKSFVLDKILKKAKEAPLHGLILVGGKSKRMDKDKAMLSYYGKPQFEHCADLLSQYVEKVYVSSREGQIEGDAQNIEQIHDIFVNQGPMGGVLSSMAYDPKAAWLVVACDLPFLDEECITNLINQRNHLKFATCYSSSTDFLPEPLCAIYEPKTRMRLMQFMSYGIRCPREVFIHSDVQYLSLVNKNALNNINHFHEYQKAAQELDQKRQHV